MNNQYYQNNLEDSNEFMDKVNEYMLKFHNTGIIYYVSRKYQQKGESFNGFEIKYDKRSANTRNLYIEYKEKSKYNTWVNSGILKDDNTLYWIIGNDIEAWMIDKKKLIRIKNKCHQHESDTSHGYLLEKSNADLLSTIKLDFSKLK